MILATIRELARALKCRPDQAEDVVRSEPSARAALSRRGLFKAAGAVAAGTLFADAVPVRDPLHIQQMILNAIKAEMDAAHAAFGRQFAQVIWAPSGFTEEQLRPRIYSLGSK